MAISAGAMAAITALSALAQAGAQGYAGYAGAEQAEKDRKYKQQQDLIAMQERDRDRLTGERRYQDGRTDAYRAEVSRKPMDSLSMLSGLSNLSQGMGRATPIDVMGFLAGSR